MSAIRVWLSVVFGIVCESCLEIVGCLQRDGVGLIMHFEPIKRRDKARSRSFRVARFCTHFHYYRWRRLLLTPLFPHPPRASHPPLTHHHVIADTETIYARKRQ